MNRSMFVYVSIALMTSALMTLEPLNNDELPSWSWVGWTRSVLLIFIAAFNTFKAYVARPPMNGNGAPTNPTNPTIP